MRVLVFSDSHGGYNNIESALLRHPDIREVVFLGDGLRDIEKAIENHPERRFFCDSGNCDFDITTPDVRLENFGGAKFFLTHGHRYSVKESLLSLFLAGKERDCRAILFGHTHQPLTDFKEGVLMLNPGSVGGRGARKATYAIIDISESGICPNILEL